MGFDQLQNPDPRTEEGSDQLKNALDAAAAQVPLPKTPDEIQAEQKQAKKIAEAADAKAQIPWDAYALKADEAKKGQEGALPVGDPAQIRLKKPVFVQSETSAGQPEAQASTSLPSEIGTAAVGQLAEIIPINGEPKQPEPPTPQPEHHDVA